MVKCSLDIEIPNVKAFCYEKQTKIYPSAQSHQQDGVICLCVKRRRTNSAMVPGGCTHSHGGIEKRGKRETPAITKISNTHTVQ